MLYTFAFLPCYSYNSTAASFFLNCVDHSEIQHTIAIIQSHLCGRVNVQQGTILIVKVGSASITHKNVSKISSQLSEYDALMTPFFWWQRGYSSYCYSYCSDATAFPKVTAILWLIYNLHHDHLNMTMHFLNPAQNIK